MLYALEKIGGQKSHPKKERRLGEEYPTSKLGGVVDQ